MAGTVQCGQTFWDWTRTLVVVWIFSWLASFAYIAWPVGYLYQGGVFPSQTSEYIIQAYKYGAFEKIPEFIAFRNRLNNSLHFAQVRTERMLLDLLLEANM